MPDYQADQTSRRKGATQYNRVRECRICLSDVGNVQITVVATVTSST
jgi:hypothetical protein